MLIVLPVIGRGALPRGPGTVRNTIFFACLGIAFMFVEIPLLQRLAVYLGHPSYATTVVLGSLLVGAGIGASLARRVPDRYRRRALFAVPLVVAVLGFTLLWAAGRTISQPFAIRAAISIVALTLAGGLMGLPFPLGMAMFDDRERSWYWAVNGATSVLASVLAIVIALITGFTTVLAFAVAIYAVAALSIPVQQRPL